MANLLAVEESSNFLFFSNLGQSIVYVHCVQSFQETRPDPYSSIQIVVFGMHMCLWSSFYSLIVLWVQYIP